MLSRRTHPQEGELIRYCDGELRAGEIERMTRHLETCSDCRTRLNHFREAFAEYLRYRRDILEPALPQPPLPWRNLHEEFARMPARRAFPRRAVWLIACAATAGTGILLYKPDQPQPARPPAIVRPIPQPSPHVTPPLPSRPVARKTAPGPEDELRVVAALDRIGAGLGDPIEVVRTRDRIVVTCLGLDPARMREVRAALAAMPGVAVELAPKPAAAPAGSPLDVVGAPHSTDTPPFVDDLLKSSEAMMARAHALRRLAVHFPPELEASLSANAKAMLAGIRERHEAALVSAVSALARSVQPPPPLTAASSPEDWQARTLRLFSEAEQVDRLLGAIYAGNRTVSLGERSALAAALAKLQADVH